MAHPFVYTFADLPTGATGSAAGIDVATVDGLRLEVVMSGTATVVVEESVIGTEWTQFGSNITATGMTDLSGFKGKMIRLRVSAYTSGVITNPVLFGRRKFLAGQSQGAQKTIAVPASVAAGAAQDFGDYDDNVRLSLSGTFVATVQWQESIDGTNWVNIGAAQTAVGVVVVTKRTRYIRANTTAYTSGTPVGTVFGRPDRTPY